MRGVLLLFVFGIPGLASAQSREPQDLGSSPFDFDHYRRTPIQARQTSTPWASKDNSNLQRELISGERGQNQKISDRAAALFQDPERIPVHAEPVTPPTPDALTDEITAARYGETTKGQQNLLARGRVADQLKLKSMSDSEYELYVARYRAEQEKVPEARGEALLRPMPTLQNTKTGGPPHAYAVSQAGVGSRAEPRDGQNPFEDLLRALRLDRPVTKGTDPLPAPPARLAVASTPAPSASVPATPDQGNPTEPESQP